jgi:iron complex transport system substrate-binding protein
VKRVFFIFILILASCSQEADTKSMDIGLRIQTPLYAKNFELGTHADSSILLIKDPDGHSIERFSFPKNVKNKVVCLSATSVGMFSLLEAQSTITGIPSSEYLSDSLLQKDFHRGRVKAFGDESVVNIERIIESGATVLLYNGFGNSFPNKSKLERMGIKVIPIYDWRESDPLGKAEWIKVIGVLCHKEQEAADYIQSIAQQYRELKQLTQAVKSKPKVISGNVIGDFWWAPAGESYSAQLIRDSGANYIFAATKGTGSVSKTMEEILSTDKAEYWLNPGFQTRKEIRDVNPVAFRMKSYKKIYCYSQKMNLYWERAAAEPQKVLEDLIRIFHPEVLPDGPFHFYSPIEQ